VAATAVSVSPFRWHDGDRLVVFGRGRGSEAADLAGRGFTLLSTPRARQDLPGLEEAAGAVHDVPPGKVDEVAAGLRETVEGSDLVALGGGRVVDVAKALAAADPPRRVVAVPTTLSGAEMTTLHRHAAGVPDTSERVRPAVVVNDPALSASQPEPALAASALNALGHAVEAPLTLLANPVATLVARQAAALLTGGLAGTEPDRDRLALGALLAGYASDSTLYGLHHVMSQTLARQGGVPHATANAIMLPHTARALERRFPEELDAMADAAGDDIPSVAAEIGARSGPVRLRDAGLTAERLAECADAASQRPELDLTPPRADRDELLALYEEAW
jgi:alcohol dehydrogenase class IV